MLILRYFFYLVVRIQDANRVRCVECEENFENNRKLIIDLSEVEKYAGENQNRCFGATKLYCTI